MRDAELWLLEGFSQFSAINLEMAIRRANELYIRLGAPRLLLEIPLNRV